MPIRHHEYVTEYLEQKKDEILKGYGKTATLMDPERWSHPEIASRKMIWILLAAYLQFMGD